MLTVNVWDAPLFSGTFRLSNKYLSVNKKLKNQDGRQFCPKILYGTKSTDLSFLILSAVILLKQTAFKRVFIEN